MKAKLKNVNKVGKSVFVAVPKKEDALGCSKQRTISTIGPMGKVLVRVVINKADGRSMRDSWGKSRD